MVRFPNCKINLGLHVASKREDGYHNIETIFYPVALKDALEIIVAEKLNLKTSGLDIKGSNEDNLCLKAWHLLKKDFTEIKPVSIHLHKVIPMGAGLGGGSSNGSFMLRMLNDQFSLQLSDDALIKYALLLGSDCPFFIANQPSFAKGRGELLERLDIDLSAYDIVLVNPGIHISTATAFGTLKPREPDNRLQDIVRQPISTWRHVLINDFEESIFKSHHAIGHIKDYLYSKGALYASMTGTGSTVYGIFDSSHRTDFVFPDTYSIQTINASK